MTGHQVGSLQATNVLDNHGSCEERSEILLLWPLGYDGCTASGLVNTLFGVPKKESEDAKNEKSSLEHSLSLP